MNANFELTNVSYLPLNLIFSNNLLIDGTMRIQLVISSQIQI